MIWRTLQFAQLVAIDCAEDTLNGQMINGELTTPERNIHNKLIAPLNTINSEVKEYIEKTRALTVAELKAQQAIELSQSKKETDILVSEVKREEIEFAREGYVSLRRPERTDWRWEMVSSNKPLV